MLVPKVEDVYVELVYSLIHAISRKDRVPSIVEDVFVYLQKAFQISEEQHQQFLTTVQQRKVTATTTTTTTTTVSLFN